MQKIYKQLKWMLSADPYGGCLRLLDPILGVWLIESNSKHDGECSMPLICFLFHIRRSTSKVVSFGDREVLT